MGKEEMTDDSPVTREYEAEGKELKTTHISYPYTLVPQQHHSILAEFFFF